METYNFFGSKIMNTEKKYRMIQFLYWMQSGVIFGFITFFLKSYGYLPSQVGIIMAVCGFLAAFIQPLLGKLSDRSSLFHWKHILLVGLGISILIYLVLFVVTQKPWNGILFGLLMTLNSCMLPFLNAMCFAYQREGEQIDFGIARGIGSFGYALIAFVLGRLTVMYSSRVVLVVGISITILNFLIILAMPYTSQVIKTKTIQKAKGSFIKKYPTYLILILSSIFFFAFHNISNTYLIDIMEHIGGDSSSLGTAIAIAGLIEIPIFFYSTTLLKRFSSNGLMLVVSGAFFLKALLLLLAKNIGMVYLAQLLQILSFAIDIAVLAHVADKSVAAEDKMVGQALNTATISFGGVIGNYFGGIVLEYFGIVNMLRFGVLLTIIGSFFVFLSMGLSSQKKNGRDDRI